jgi:hypothetical protein
LHGVIFHNTIAKQGKGGAAPVRSTISPKTLDNIIKCGAFSAPLFIMVATFWAYVPSTWLGGIYLFKISDGLLFAHFRAIIQTIQKGKRQQRRES